MITLLMMVSSTLSFIAMMLTDHLEYGIMGYLALIAAKAYEVKSEN